MESSDASSDILLSQGQRVRKNLAKWRAKPHTVPALSDDDEEEDEDEEYESSFIDDLPESDAGAEESASDS